MEDEILTTVTDEYEPEPEPTPEDYERWEREREEREAAQIAPYQAIAEAMNDRDEAIAEILFELTMKDLEG